MYRVELNTVDRQQVQALARQQGVPARVHERLEMVRLGGAGWNIPAIARHLGRHEQTVRKVIKGYLADGLAGLWDRRPPGRPRRLTESHLAALGELLETTERTWTTPQLVGWLHEQHRVSVHPDYLSVRLKQRGFRWKRMTRSVRHKQADPALQATARRELEALKSPGATGPGGPVLPGSERICAHPADRLHLDARRPAQAAAL